MRFVADSTRTTIRLATVLAAAAALMLALAAPFVGTAHADEDNDSYLTFTDTDENSATHGESHTVWFRSTQKGDLVFSAFDLPYEDSIHISCSEPLFGLPATATGDNPVFAAGTEVKVSAYYIKRHGIPDHSKASECGTPMTEDDDEIINEDDDEIIDDEDDEIIDDEDDEIVNEDDDEIVNGDDTGVLDETLSNDDDTVDGGTDGAQDDVKVLDEVAVADELPATGLETTHLALLAALLAALGVLFLLGTETDKVRAYRA
jgi:hypothetical protein